MIRSQAPLALVLVTLALGLPQLARAGDEPSAKTPAEFFELYKGCYDSKSKSFSWAKLYDQHQYVLARAEEKGCGDLAGR